MWGGRAPNPHPGGEAAASSPPASSRGQDHGEGLLLQNEAPEVRADDHAQYAWYHHSNHDRSLCDQDFRASPAARERERARLIAEAEEFDNDRQPRNDRQLRDDGPKPPEKEDDERSWSSHSSDSSWSQSSATSVSSASSEETRSSRSSASSGKEERSVSEVRARSKASANNRRKDAVSELSPRSSGSLPSQYTDYTENTEEEWTTDTSYTSHAVPYGTHAVSSSNAVPSGAPRNYPFDFHVPGVQLGAWCKSDHVRKGVQQGFTISPDLNQRGKCPPRLKCRTVYEEAYLQQLVDDGVLVPGRAVWNHPHFWNYAGGKLRLIFNGVRFNKATKDPPRFNMKSHHTVRVGVAKHQWAYKLDLKNCFFNCLINVLCQCFFGIRTAIGDFCYTRLPFGFKWSPFIAHCLVDQFVRYFRAHGCEVSHFMDDLYGFADSEEEANRHLDFIIEYLELHGVRVAASKTFRAAQQMSILGVEYDLVRKTAWMPESLFTKLRRTILNLRDLNRVSIAHVVGVLSFCNTAYPGSLSLLQSLMAFQMATEERPDRPSWRQKLGRNALRKFRPLALRVLEKFAAFPPMRVQTAPVSFTEYWSDATTRVAGIALPHRPPVGYRFVEPLPIFEAEAVGVLFATDARDPQHGEITFRIDNEALFHAFRKGRSKVNAVNNVIAHHFFLRLDHHLIFRYKWCSTHDNLADAPTRQPHLFARERLDGWAYLASCAPGRGQRRPWDGFCC